MGEQHTLLGDNLVDLAQVLADDLRPEEALPSVEEAIEIYAHALPPHHEYHHVAASLKGLILYNLGRQEEGLPLLENAHRALYDRFGPSHYLTEDALNRLEQVESRRHAD
ncbi:hypothetical protein [Sulfidibacter corallicola]|uniref:Tetratricopeptide repeat protein n=1 Tax=Sulfidibacter corallicola TaxID=2818388 RepID=A0A8A4THF9_SULCO|nr:hypothetical protein [Sulfidibacter corallicola]QTD49073.1 hypothetical protein J3U87_26095 [Sulfidibacter corallicola]